MDLCIRKNHASCESDSFMGWPEGIAAWAAFVLALAQNKWRSSSLHSSSLLPFNSRIQKEKPSTEADVFSLGWPEGIEPSCPVPQTGVLTIVLWPPYFVAEGV